jgi:Ca-activated chloride channel family protein
MDATLLVDAVPQPALGGWVVRALLTLTGEAPPALPGARPAVPLNVALVLDRSGSMAGEPLEAARGAAAGLVRRLRPTDVVSVVAYDHEVQTLAEPATGAAQATLARAIEAIEARGSTNLSGGWLRGRDLVDAARGTLDAARAPHPGVDGATGPAGLTDHDGASSAGSHRIVLLTDGLANAGITDPATLLRLCALARAAGVTTTRRFGPDYDEHLLRGMADAGGGNSYYVERSTRRRRLRRGGRGLLSLAGRTSW